MSVLMLDTSAAIEILRGQQPPADLADTPYVLSTVVEMELWAGVYHAGGEAEREKIEALLKSATVLAFDRSEAHEAAKVLAELTRAGQRIGDFDSQIAGHARLLGAALLSANERHFNRVAGLQVIPWHADSGGECAET